MAEDMNNLVQLRGRLKGSITRALAFAERPAGDCTYEQVLARLERLDEVWQQFNCSVNDMYKFKTSADYVDPDSEFASYEEKFLSARGRLFALKSFLAPEHKNGNNNDAFSQLASQQASFLKQFSSVTNSPTVFREIDLPKINIQPFSGQYKDWPSFRDLFVSSIDSKSHITNTQKFHYLMSLLRDEAANIVKHMPITDAAYNTAWSQLVDRFDRPRHIVNSFIETFMSLPSVTTENSNLLRKISDGANEIVRGMDAINHRERDCWLIHLLVAKVDPETRRRWVQDSKDNTFPQLADFFDFLDTRCEELELSQRYPTPKNQGASKPNQTFSRSLVSHNGTNQRCSRCNAADHIISKCSIFLSLSTDERRLFVKSKSLCFNCLRAAHTSYSCSSKFRCRECRRRHHTLVHIPQFVATEPTSPLTSTLLPLTEYSSTAQTLIGHQGSISLLPTALVEVRNSQGQFITCRVLLDCASELSYISERCAHRLGFSRSPSRIVVTGISSVKAETTRGCFTISIKSRFSEHSLNACVHVLNNITSSLPRSTLNKTSAEYFCGKDLADPSYYISSPIDILLGINHVWNIFTFDKIFDAIGNLVAVSSIFGWVITSAASTEEQTISSFVSTVDIDRSIRSFWEIEEASFPLPTDPHNVFVEQHFLKTYSRHVDGKYIVSLPFKEQNVTFSNTLQGALSRFTALERRLVRDSTLLKKYVDFMREYIRLGHMRELNCNEISVSDGRLFYMPHHPILGPKLRVVFDGSFQDTSGVSLNNTLHIGPSIQRNLFAVCLRFRLHRFVFSADIVKMFRQIWVAEKLRNYQRIVWRETPSDPIKHYQLCTVTYGTSCAPFLSIRVLEQLAQDYKNEHPIASKILTEDFYVDDVLTGAPTEVELIQKRDDLVKLLKRAGLELRKWVSNNDSITSNLSNLPETIAWKLSENETTRVLGIYWKPNEDNLAYKVRLQPSLHSSKRQVLSDVSRVFDPLGLLAPVVIQFKILFQQLWLHNLSWDDPLLLNMAKLWLKFRNDIKNIERLSLPRFIYNSVDTIELHGFSDASIKAYAAVVYCRCRDEKGEYQVNLVAAKTRVAPLKQLSLPRLELYGAVLLTRLMSSIKENLLHKSVIIKAWCDSTIVLSWLSQPPVKLKTFVANRTAEILDTLPRNIWNYVASKANPADCASRGLLVQDLLKFDLCCKGPSWLHNDELYQSTISKSNNFNTVSDSEYTTEVKSTVNMFTTEEKNKVAIMWGIDRISSWRRLLRVIAYVLRFVKRFHPRNRRQLAGGLTFEEINDARVILFRYAQNNFDEDRANLQNETELSRNSKLLKLSPFLDNDGIIRVGGRICNSQLDAAAQHPIILPKDHRVTMLILLDEHERHLHLGVSALFFIIRQKYWVFGARNLIRQLTHKCIKCFRQRQLSMHQQMANLPAIRVRQAFPFENSGVDYAGPFTLKMYRGRNARTSKGYICLFVCLVTSAIHLELATDLTTDCFLAALRRFMSRRGKCSQILSDNGRNFIGASRVLGEMHKIVMSQLRNEIVTASLAEDGIRWSFNPPHAPHWGGIWESAVRSVKLHLRRVIGNTVLTFEQMHTLLTQIEAVINSRPLGVTADSEINYLSPSHFLIGRPYTMIPEGDLSEVQINRLDYWQHVQNMYQGFWRKWHQEYLTSLQQRPKWQTPQPNVDVGNIVVKENNTAPAKWLMAKIIETYSGDGGLVRAVRLRTTYGEMTRPITKIAVLPFL